MHLKFKRCKNPSGPDQDRFLDHDHIGPGSAGRFWYFIYEKQENKPFCRDLLGKKKLKIL
jgi:hypothetical protein